MRRWIAKMLAPEAFRAEDELGQLKSELELDRRWLGEFPSVAAVLDRHLRRKTSWSADIALFREQLRQMPTHSQALKDSSHE